MSTIAALPLASSATRKLDAPTTGCDDVRDHCGETEVDICSRVVNDEIDEKKLEEAEEEDGEGDEEDVGEEEEEEEERDEDDLRDEIEKEKERVRTPMKKIEELDWNEMLINTMQLVALDEPKQRVPNHLLDTSTVL